MRFLISALAPLTLLAVSPVWGQDYLYRPQPVAQDAQAQPADGVLVREVLVKKGDTLSHLSKRFSGRGAYYPQILLFNDIRNPNLIHTGDVLRVPVGHRHTGQPVKLAAKQSAAAVPQSLPLAAPVAKPAPAPPAAGTQKNGVEQADYNRAMAAVKRGDCTDAVAQFDRFITRYPQSALVPDATLNRAECYLKLSAK